LGNFILRKNLKRIDEWLVEKGHCSDLKQAASMVMAGQVVVDNQRVRHCSQLFASTAEIRIKLSSHYVGRGADKLKSILDKLELNGAFQDAYVLDVGASTGGFTQLCLELGAKEVIALDVGTNQLDWRLRTDRRVISLERTDLRDFRLGSYEQRDWILVDVSFISLIRLGEALMALGYPEKTKLLLLVKPQFELPRDLVPEGGVVLDENMRNQAVNQVQQAMTTLGLNLRRRVDSPIKGRSGNQETFLLFDY
jgi:23S rRNA (cytidine1920-2'-O)/16S rRNA (cytidine1409-2'-O)-methyltransferase